MKQTEILNAKMDLKRRLIRITRDDCHVEFEGIVFDYSIGTGPNGLTAEIEFRQVDALRVVCEIDEPSIRVLNPDGSRP